MTSPGGTLTERLQLVVDATTSQAESRFQKLTGAARETGDAAQTSANSVRDAADRLAAARDRELTATGNLRVAETRLQDLRQSGRARADQLAAAEEKVAAAERGLHLATRNVERATEEQTAAQGRAANQADRTERSTSRLGDAMEQVRGRAAALGGAGLVALLSQVGAGFATGARDAGQLATSMNATVDEAGAFLGLVGSLGLELNDLLEIQAEFAQKVTDNGSALEKLGVQTERNANGTVNWADTLVSFLDELQGVEDATERNRLGFMFLGEEGFKQLSRLVNSGTDVRDALEMIGTPFTEADVQMAADYDAAMLELSLTSQRTQQQLGRVLLPVITGLAEGLGDLVDVVDDIPLPLAVATAAALALGITGWSPTAAAGARLSGVMAIVNRELLLFRVAAATSTPATAALTAGLAGASAAGGRLMTLAGGPLGLAMIAAGAGFALASEGSNDLRENARKAAEELLALKLEGQAVGIATRKAANDLEENAGYWERSAAYVRGYQEDLTGVEAAAAKLLEPFQRLTGGFGDTADTAKGFELAIEDAKRELGAFGAQQQTAQVTSRALNDLIAEGTTEGAQFAEAVKAAAEAEASQTRTSDLAAAALAAYNATTRDAVQTQLDLFSAQLQQRDGLIGLQQTVHEAREVVDDLSTPWNEVEEATNRVIGSALDYGSTAADAAVAAATATGTVVDALAEARIRADATLGALREGLQVPNLTDAAREQIQGMITKLEEAQAAGDVEAILRLTGVEQTKGDLDETTKDRDTIVKVESRNGPAVKSYLDGLALERLTLIRVESRNGPAVRDYLGDVAAERLSIIRVESRGGPAVDEYLDRLASASRVAYIDVRQRGGAGVAGGLTGAPMMRGAPGAYGSGYGSGGDVVIQNQQVILQADSSGRVAAQTLAQAGRDTVAAIRAYERQNGAAWRNR